MGYYSSAFAFYGFEIELVDWDKFDVLQTSTPFCLVSTGCQATGKPPKRQYVILKSSFHKILAGNYDITDVFALEGTVTGPEYEQAREYCKTNELIIKDVYELPYFKWFVGCQGG